MIHTAKHDARPCVAAPCDAEWDQHRGAARARRCDQCGVLIYDFSDLTADQSMQLVQAHEGLSTGRLFRRHDGRFMTRNCPRGLEALRQRLQRAAG